jgi:hypothetical protein
LLGVWKYQEALQNQDKWKWICFIRQLQGLVLGEDLSNHEDENISQFQFSNKNDCKYSNVCLFLFMHFFVEGG